MKKPTHLLTILLLASSTFFTSLFAQDIGDYRTVSDGNWANSTIWETYNGTNWTTTSFAPQGGLIISITVRHKIVTTDSLSITIKTKVLITEVARLDIYGPITNNGTIQNEGLINWSSGNINTSDSLASGNILNKRNGVIQIEIFDDAYTSNQRISNAGRMVKFGPKTLTINELRDSVGLFDSDSTATFVFYNGLLDVKTGSTLRGTAVNYGTIRLSNRHGMRFKGTLFQNENKVVGNFFQLDSNALQQLRGSGRFERLLIKNPYGLSILSEQIIENQLDIQSGKVNLLGNTITLGTSVNNIAPLIGGSDTAYFYNGTISRWVNNPDTVSFPIGTQAAFLPALIVTEERNGGGLLSLKYTISNPLTWGLELVDNTFKVSTTCATCGVWEAATSTNFISRYRLVLGLSNYPGINRPADLRIIYRPKPSAPWQLTGQHSDGGGTSPRYIARRNNLTVFGEFAIGGGGLNTLLPVELTQFTASRKGNAAFLAWETASEKNSNYFDIERSNDGREFNSIGQIKAFGTTLDPKRYQFLDAQPENPIQYYRLKIVDNDGTYGYSPIRSVVFDKTIKAWAYPNPFSEKLTVEVDNTEGGKSFDIDVTDITGKQCFSLKNIDNQSVIADFKHLPNGVYFAKITKGKTFSVFKIMKQEGK